MSNELSTCFCMDDNLFVFDDTWVVVANPVVEITPPKISIFVPAVKPFDITLSTILILVPAYNSSCNPVVEITPPVMSTLVLPTKSHDIKLPTILIFVPAVKLSCFPCIVSSKSPIVGRVNVSQVKPPIILKGKLNEVITSDVTRLLYRQVVGKSHQH